MSQARRGLARYGVSALVVLGAGLASWFLYTKVLHRAPPTVVTTATTSSAPVLVPSASSSAGPAPSTAEMPRWMTTIEEGQQLLAAGDPDGALKKFKDPAQFVVSSVRLAYDGKTITNFHPIVNWLQQLGEPLYLRVTPDGYPLTEDAWASSGQLVKRFEIARQIGSGNAGLFNNDDNTPGPFIGFPLLNSRLFYSAIEPALGAKTTAALSRASSQQEWNLLLLASPDWMQR